jgi:hypothetical protein
MTPYAVAQTTEVTATERVSSSASTNSSYTATQSIAPAAKPRPAGKIGINCREHGHPHEKPHQHLDALSKDLRGLQDMGKSSTIPSSTSSGSRPPPPSFSPPPQTGRLAPPSRAEEGCATNVSGHQPNTRSCLALAHTPTDLVKMLHKAVLSFEIFFGMRTSAT